MQDIIIYQPWGGLGDNLQFSTLPELYAAKGHKVYISKDNVYRNPEIYDLVWKSNPFVSGISDGPPNAGSCRGTDGTANYFLTNIEQAHGLYDGYRKYPIVYYTPKLIPSLESCLLYDPTSISTNPSDTNIENTFQSIIDKHPGLKVKKIVFSRINNRGLPSFNHEPYVIQTIYDMCDAIYSCKVFLTVFSGAAVLASALKQDNPTPLIYSIHPPEQTSIGYKFHNEIYVPFVTTAASRPS
jgi:hypothetical protein